MELKANGDEQVIGCTVVDIFDDNGRFRQGRLELNIWPFYKIDSRIASINNYNGVPMYRLFLLQQRAQGPVVLLEANYCFGLLRYGHVLELARSPSNATNRVLPFHEMQVANLRQFDQERPGTRNVKETTKSVPA
jgi:hypothetical protein